MLGDPAEPPTAPRIRVALADDDLFVRTALGTFLDSRPELDLVGLCEDGERAVQVAREAHVDVFLMDIHMPVLDGMAATRQILQHAPTTRVLMLTSFDDETSLQGALGSGAAGYLLKSSSPRTLLDAIRAVHSGSSVLSPDQLLHLRAHEAASVPPHVELSDNDRRVARLLCQGMSNAQIAASLFVSESTVKLRLASLSAKLGTATRVATAVRALQLGLAAPDDSSAPPGH